MSDRGVARPRLGYPAAAVVFTIGMLGTTLPTPLYGLYQKELGFSEFVVTIVFAVYAIGVIVALLIAGDYSDKVGRRPVLLCALCLSAASALCFVFEGGLPVLLVGRLLSGFSAGLFSGAATVTVLELAQKGSEARAGFAATAANMGGLGCGPLIAGLLAQYAPAPLTLPFLVDLGLIAVACVLLWMLPETVPKHDHPGLRPRGFRVPPQARDVFKPAALAGFAGFALIGLFTAVSSSFIATTLHVNDHAVAGVIVFSVLLSSVAGQSLTDRVGVRLALPGGCFVLVVALLLVAASLYWKSIGLLVGGAVCGGLGQGLSFRAAVGTVSAAAPPDERGGTVSSFFVIGYIGISLPVVGVGALDLLTGLRYAGLVFSGCVMLLAAGVGLFVLRRPPRPA